MILKIVEIYFYLTSYPQPVHKAVPCESTGLFLSYTLLSQSLCATLSVDGNGYDETFEDNKMNSMPPKIQERLWRSFYYKYIHLQEKT